MNIGLALTRVFWKYLGWAIIPFPFMLGILIVLDRDAIEAFSSIYLAFLLSFYGYTRIRRFHPIFNKDYLSLLAISPWDHRKALPRGPIHLCWADAVILVFFVILSLLLSGKYWPIPLFAFFAGHIIGLCNAFCKTGQIGFILLYALFVPLTFYPTFNLIVSFGILVALTGAGYYGLHCYLREFPWNTPWWIENPIKTMKNEAVRRRIIQWPFNLIRVEQTIMIALGASALISMVVFGGFTALIMCSFNSEANLYAAQYIQYTDTWCYIGFLFIVAGIDHRSAYWDDFKQVICQSPPMIRSSLLQFACC